MVHYEFGSQELLVLTDSSHICTVALPNPLVVTVALGIVGSQLFKLKSVLESLEVIYLSTIYYPGVVSE